ncbi:uncharacterized protein [Oscarella lobularis]|uniref:uncharacterized protein isoform X2 n=1 Tax=Oscarella lobularis TaxID=121494 RepID=UPI003313C815
MTLYHWHPHFHKYLFYLLKSTCRDMKSQSKADTEPTPVNWRVVLVSFAIVAATTSTISVSFPYLPWMVRKFRIDGEFVQSEDKGYYTGLIASAYFVGQFVGSYFWGLLADKKSRRLAILLSATALAVFTFMFGFTNTYTGLPWALVMRALSGASNGVLAVSKAAIADVSDDSNQAKGITVVAVAWGVGFMIGPALGGILADPVRQYPNTFSWRFLRTFPYFLPSAVSASLLLIGVVVVYCFLPETSKKRSSQYNEAEKETIVLNRIKSKGAEDYGSVHMEKTEVRTENESEPVSCLRRLCDIGRRARHASFSAMKNSTWWSILKIYEARMAVFLYFLVAFCLVGWEELTILWMATKTYRGTSFTERKIGVFQSVLALVQIPLQIFFFHRLEKKLGGLKTFHLACIGSALIAAINPVFSSIERDFFQLPAIFISFTLTEFCMGALLIMVSLFINNSVPKQHVGAVNGLATSLSSIASMLAPSFGTSLFAWSIDEGAKHIGFPLDYHFAFYLFSLVYLVSLLLSVNLPNSLQKQKRE